MNKYFTSLGASCRFLVGHPGFAAAPLANISRAIAFYLLIGLGRKPRVRLNALDIAYDLPQLYRGPAKVFYVFRENYEDIFGFIAQYVKEGEVFVDVGANFGLYSILAARLVGSSGRVICYEPFPQMANLTSANIGHNHFGKRAILREVALSDKAQVSRLFVHQDPGRNSIGKLEENGTLADSIEISVTTLDLEDDAGVFGGRVDWIKIDAEGAEPFILKGGLEFMKKYQPTLIIEFNEVALRRLGWSAVSLGRFLLELNYKIFRWADSRLVLETASGAVGDFIIIHESKLGRFEIR